MRTTPRIIEGRIKAWLPGHNDPRDLDGAPVDALSAMGFSNHDMAPDWLLLGEARIEVTIRPADELLEGQIASLRKKQGELMAESTKLESKIQSLLAIGHTREVLDPF